jgi:adenylate cyclase
LREIRSPVRTQEGVTRIDRDPKISPDLKIVGVDFQSLSTLGQWPFPRSTHAELINSFTRVQDQTTRERSILLDFFFVEPSDAPHTDALLIDSMYVNGRVFLETILESSAPPSYLADELFRRHEELYRAAGEIRNVSGDWTTLPSHFGLQPPLQPYARAVTGYGHANYTDDYDSVFRRQALIARIGRPIRDYYLDELSTDTQVDHGGYQRLVWFDNRGNDHTIPYPLTDAVLEDLEQQMKQYAPPVLEDTNDRDNTGGNGVVTPRYRVRLYQESFVPSVTLSLALDYFHRDFQDLEIVVGSHIRIPDPLRYDPDTNSLEPYRIMKQPERYEDGRVVEPAVYENASEIIIPIDNKGEMLINYMGPRSGATGDEPQTFPVRSYSAYVARVPGLDPETWPRTRAVGNNILMVGAFAPGMAADEKMTPYGLMYGIEVHANALNTILMNNFLRYAPSHVDVGILALFAILAAWMSSRFQIVLAFLISTVGIVVYFFGTTILFDEYAYILNFSSPALAALLSMVSVIVYRVMTEERDKKRIREMFGKYVSPDVVSEILETPPELGGVDRELTVFFSDIRGFTTLSEAMTPQELVNHLNIYLTRMTDIILEYKGTLDKYVGDEIMCFWGAPIPQQEHAILACKCAIRQIQALNELNAGWSEEKRISIGIGINSGIMTVGNMGSMGRMNYTLMGDNVNLAARLEGTNKVYGTTILISEYTYGLVQDRVIARELDNIRVKGKNKPVIIYELIDIPEGLAPPKGLHDKD